MDGNEQCAVDPAERITSAAATTELRAAAMDGNEQCAVEPAERITSTAATTALRAAAIDRRKAEQAQFEEQRDTLIDNVLLNVDYFEWSYSQIVDFAQQLIITAADNYTANVYMAN
jgi:hypothetical protein